jgi:hypothetical protein
MGDCWNFMIIGAYFPAMKLTGMSVIAKNGVKRLILIEDILFCTCQDIGDHSLNHDLWERMERDGLAHIKMLRSIE